MAATETERLLNLIGQILSNDTEYPVGDTLLYSDVDTDMAGVAVFKNVGARIVYRDRMDDLFDVLLELWEQAPADKRWAEIEYVLRDRRFETTFTYRDQIDPSENPDERRARIVARYFGDKPIVYPPWDDTVGQTFKL